MGCKGVFISRSCLHGDGEIGPQGADGMANSVDPDQTAPLIWVCLSVCNHRTIMIKQNNQRTNGPVNAHLISWPSKAQNIQNLENIW